MNVALRSTLQLATCILFTLASSGCGGGTSSLCERYFEPYPDMVSGRVANNVNSTYIDAMQAYAEGDFAKAATGLEQYLQTPRRDADPRLYLACAYLATGDPFKAELQLDHISNSGINEFNDQVDWYNALCLLCGGQAERALAQAEWIAARARHTYKEQAARLAADLGR